MRSIIILSATIVLATSGCGIARDWKLPGVYRIPIQQGTVIEQSMINRLEPGMSKDQVQFIMGTPVIVDPFHSKRWEYIYSFKKGSDSVREQRHVTLHFDDEEKLDYITGDIQPVDPALLAAPAPQANRQQEVFVVPKRSKPGLFGGLFGGGSDDEPIVEDSAEEDLEVIQESGDGGSGGGDY